MSKNQNGSFVLTLPTIGWSTPTGKIIAIITLGLCFTFLSGFVGMRVHPRNVDPSATELAEKESLIYRIKPEPRGGQAFKLVYLVKAPRDLYWRFKTDFAGTFQVSNRYVKIHRLVYETDTYAITENRYTNAPGETFRWRTAAHHDRYRLEFRLENPDECGHKFHHGSIQLEPFGNYTKVTHIAYFDFFGANVWVNLPFKSGMRAFLTYIARWENETIARLHHMYVRPP